MKWHQLPTISAAMLFQMELDEALFRRAKDDPSQPSVLRFYYSSGPCITAGIAYSRQSREPASGVDSQSRLGSAVIRKNPGVPVVKRITGGGCVLHGQDLIFSLIARYENSGGVPFSKRGASDGLLGSVKTSYQNIHEAVKLAYRSLGFDPKFYEDHEDLPRGADCFDFPVASDLSWKGRKIAGGAQKRSGGVLLHHESVRVPDGAAVFARLAAGIRSGLEKVLDVTIDDSNLDADLYFETQGRVRQRELGTGSL